MRLWQTWLVALAIGLTFCASPAKAITWSPLIDPLDHFQGTQVNDIQGNLVVGTYKTNEYSVHGFVFNSTTQTWTSLNDPSASGSGTVYAGTFLNGIDGNTIVGNYGDNGTYTEQGLLYDIPAGTWTTANDPLQSGGIGTFFNGISGNYVVGAYQGQSQQEYGLLYNTATQSWLALNDPSFTANPNFGVYSNTVAMDDDGNLVVGYYTTSAGNQGDIPHGFLYNIATQTWTTLDSPLAANSAGYGTEITAISGNDILGYYGGTDHAYRGFLYNMATGAWTYLSDPGGGATFPTGIAGNTVVGYDWNDGYLDEQGFVAVLPEPSGVVLFLLGGASLTALAFRNRRVNRPSDASKP